MKRKLVSVAVLVLLLLNLSIGVFAAGDEGPIRPEVRRAPICQCHEDFVCEYHS